MVTYNKDSLIRFPEDVTENLVKYMQETNQGQILLRRNKRYFYVTLHDGATNQYQEPGYHDHIYVLALPMPITLPELDSE